MKILKEYGLEEPLYLMMEESNEVIGVLPFFYVDVFPFGKALMSPTDCNGLLLNDICASRDRFGKLLASIENEAKKYNVAFVKLRLNKFSILNSFMSNKYLKQNEYGIFILDMQEGAEKIFKTKIHKKTRTAIRKASKLGIEVNEGVSNVEIYWKFYEETMIRTRGILDENRRKLFRLIWTQLKPKKDFLTLTAMFKGKPIGGIMAFLFRDKVHVWYNSSLSQFLYLNPNEFLYWKLIERASDMGYKYVDFGPTPLLPSEGHHFFKARFGGTMIPFNDYSFFTSNIRSLLIERGLLQLAKKYDIRQKIPYAVLRKMSGRVIF